MALTKKQKEKIKYLAIQVLYEDLPKFLASDGKQYGDFRQNDMAIIPEKDALRLIQKEQAKELIMELGKERVGKNREERRKAKVKTKVLIF